MHSKEGVVRDKIIEWLVMRLLTNLTPEVAAKALIGLLRAASVALKSLAAKTDETKIDDRAAEKIGQIVEELAKLLNVP